MNLVFADAFYFLALLNSKDSAHQKALAWAAGMPRARLVTTTHVITEVADGLSGSRQRGKAITLIRNLFASPAVTIVSVDSELFESGLRIYEARPDKDWSLTDCSSFVVMERERVTESLTGDHHFTQAGFRALLA